MARIDWADLREGVLHETKKGRSTEDAHRWQLRFYLWLLKLCGVTRGDRLPFTGMLNSPALKRTEAVELTADDEARLAEMVAELRRLADEPRPPRRRFCRACAFEELCYG